MKEGREDDKERKKKQGLLENPFNDARREGRGEKLLQRDQKKTGEDKELGEEGLTKGAGQENATSLQAKN